MLSVTCPAACSLALPGGRIGPNSTTTSGVAISVATSQIKPKRRAWLGSLIVYTASMKPSIQPRVCIGPPKPLSHPAAHGTKHCQW